MVLGTFYKGKNFVKIVCDNFGFIGRILTLGLNTKFGTVLNKGLLFEQLRLIKKILRDFDKGFKILRN